MDKKGGVKGGGKGEGRRKRKYWKNVMEGERGSEKLRAGGRVYGKRGRER